MAAQLMLSLSILVVLHEFGHFAPARWFGCRVEKFYLFFDPYFELFKKKIGETECGIGWLPLGGYVKISGMIDESMDTEQMEGPPQPWEFRSKPAWQRLIIMLGGVTVNFVLGFAIFIGLLWYYGEQYIPTSAVTQGIYAECLGELYGLRTGDKVLAIDTVRLERFGERYVKNEILLRGARTLTVERAGQTLEIALPDSLQRNLTNPNYQREPLYSLPIEPRVDTILPGTPAAASDLAQGDRVVAVNGVPVAFQQDILAVLDGLPEGTDGVEVTVRRDGRTRTLPVGLTPERRMGFAPYIEDQYGYVRDDYTLAEAIPAGIEAGWQSLADQADALTQVFDNKLAAGDSVGSVFTMGRAFGSTWNWQRFWRITGLLSLILAIMNLLPIPALDGGHVTFLLYEVITGRKPGDKFLQYATTAGAVLLMAFMAVVLLNDAVKAFKDPAPVAKVCDRN